VSNPREIINAYLCQRGQVFWLDVRSDANAEQACALDYQGRVLFELLQNAVDRAKQRIWVHLDDTHGKLYFANDGTPFSMYALEGVEKLSDFHALCSIYISSKSAAESIGNKGVGFKAVWEVAHRARIHSKREDGAWWGFRLYHPLAEDTITKHTDSHHTHPLRRLVEDRAVPNLLPSFYFPEYLDLFDDCPTHLSEAVTVIVLEWAVEDQRTTDKVHRLLDEFRQTRYFFLSEKLQQRRRPASLEIRISGDRDDTCNLSTNPDPWMLGRWEEQLPDWEARQSECMKLANELKFDLQSVSLTIAIPPEQTDLQPEQMRFYSYLPTDVRCGFSILVHADFFLDNSRKAIDFDKPLNTRLIEHAADLLLHMLMKDPQVSRRPDLWRFLNPTGGAEPLIEAIRERLFGQDAESSQRFQELLRITFRDGELGPQPITRYQTFLEAMSAWKARLVTRMRADARRRETENLLYSRVRSAQVACVPVVIEGDLVKKAVCLPKLDGTGRKIPAVFYSRSQGEDESASMHSLLVFSHEGMEGLAVTNWEGLRDVWEDLGLTLFVREAIIREVSNVLGRAESEARTEQLPHEEILCFLWKLLAHPSNTGAQTSFGLESKEPERLRQHESGERMLGSRFARFRVPVEGGGWQPAGRVFDPRDSDLSQLMQGVKNFYPLDWNKVNAIPLHPLPDGKFIVDRFLRLLGVWDCVPLVVDGEGVRLALDLPSLSGEEVRRLAATLSKNWSRYRNLEEGYRTSLCRFLRSQEWFPLDRQRNFSEKTRPTLVWIVPDGDREKLCYWHKYALDDLHLSEELLKDIGITREDGTAGVAKIHAQLDFMQRAWAEHPEIQAGLAQSQRFKPRYRAMVRLLSRCPDLAAGPVNVPLLCEKEAETWWRDQLDPGTKIYFYGESSRRWRTLFLDLIYAVVEPDTPREFATRLGLLPFDLKQEIHGVVQADLATKNQIAPALPFFMALVDGIRFGARIEEDFRRYVDRWQRLEVLQGHDIYLEVQVGNERARHLGMNHSGDVWVKKSGDRLQLLHDLSQETLDAKRLESFAEPLASAVFENVLYTEYFARVLDLWIRQSSEEDLLQYLKSRGVDSSLVDSYKRMVAEMTLQSAEEEQLQREVATLIEQLTGQRRDPADVHLLTLNPKDFQPPSDTSLRAADVNDRLPERLKQLGIQIDCAARNRRTLAERLLQLKTPVLVACLLKNAACRDGDMRDQLLADYDCLGPKEMAEFERLAFDPDPWIRAFLQKHGVSAEGDLLAWARMNAESREYVEGCIFLDTGLRFSAVSNVSEMKGTLLTLIPCNKGNTSRPVATVPLVERQESDARKHIQGLSAERAFAWQQAVTLLPQITDNWPTLHRELERVKALAELKNLDITQPKTIEALADRLHVAHYYDGLGYDVLTVDEDGHLVRVEVKSSTYTSQFYLTEPERRNARRYLEDKASSGDHWKLILYVQQGGQMMPYDATAQARQAILSYDPPSGGLQPVEYLVRILVP
jgi:hypothetical protein